MEGDDLGYKSLLTLEGKLHFYDVNPLTGIGLIPYLYGNMFLPGAADLTSYA